MEYTTLYQLLFLSTLTFCLCEEWTNKVNWMTYYATADQSYNRTSAAEECRKRGSRLAILADVQTHTDAHDSLPIKNRTLYWIGLQKGDQDCTCGTVGVECEACRLSWRWDDGTPMKYNKWNGNMPWTVDVRDCGSENSNNNWESNNCGRASGFICQYRCSDTGCKRSQCHFQHEVYTCTCDHGFEGTHCDRDIDECSKNPCQHRGTCVNTPGSYHCRCLPGYTGDDCETDINECGSSPCYQGSCVDLVGGYRCDCVADYTGRHCESEIDQCESNPCVNNSTCLDLVARYNCTCAEPFTGDNCEHENTKTTPTGQDCSAKEHRMKVLWWIQGITAITALATWLGMGACWWYDRKQEKELAHKQRVIHDEEGVQPHYCNVAALRKR